jgi:hypothetical protein
MAGSAAQIASVHADAASDTQSQIQAAYTQRDTALNHFDIEGYMASYDGTYKNVSGTGKPGTTDLQRLSVISDFQHAQDLTRHETIQSVIPYNDGVTVMTVAVTTRTVKDAKTGQSVRRIDTDQDRAFWVHTKMGWRIKQERTMSRQETQG